MILTQNKRKSQQRAYNNKKGTKSQEVSRTTRTPTGSRAGVKTSYSKKYMEIYNNI